MPHRRRGVRIARLLLSLSSTNRRGRTFGRPLADQAVEGGCLVALPRRGDEGDRPALALGPDLDFRVPPLPRPRHPEGARCARTVVPSTKRTAQSKCPAASASAWSAANTRSQIPVALQR